MATTYSTQLTAWRAGKAQRQTYFGNSERISWDYVVPAATNPIGDLIVLQYLPQGTKLYGGRESHSAMGASATGAISLYLCAGPDSTDLGAAVASTDIQAAVTYTAAGTNAIGLTEATLLYYVTLTPVLLVTTVAGLAFPAGGTLKGHLDIQLAH